MAENIVLEVVTPEKQVVNESVQMVVSPGELGEFGVLAGHTSFMTTLKTGSLRYTDETGTERFVFVSGGFAEALPDKLTVLAESAERRQDIDVVRAEESAKRAQNRLDAQQDEVDYQRARAALEKALHRLSLAKTR
jgi:F-type H+-transporting ATPase subunit epsilon